MKNKKLFARVVICFRSFLLFVVISCIIGSFVDCLNEIGVESTAIAQDLSNSITDRVSNTTSLLHSLTSDSEIANTSLSLQERVQKLKAYSVNFEYQSMGVTDENYNVYTTNDNTGNVTQLEYMQELYNTGETKVTDLYASNEDGSVLVYTIAVPLKDGDRVVGSIFASINHNELDSLVEEKLGEHRLRDLLIFDGDNTVLASTEDGTYDLSLAYLFQSSFIFQDSLENITSDFENQTSGNYCSIKNNNFYYVHYQHIENTPWTVMYRGSVLAQLYDDLMPILIRMLIIVVIGVHVDSIIRKQLHGNFNSIEKTIDSLQEIRDKIHSEDGVVDDQSILDISSQGLIDNLTGLYTRTVFTKTIEGKLEHLDNDEQSIICFIDLDNLKTINDQYGHLGGDNALKTIGYVLRRYEKVYDGLATRYGGDEFIIFLPHFTSRKDIDSTLESLIDELNTTVEVNEETCQVHCSMGITFYPTDGDNINDLIAKADKALYKAKRLGKNTYCIFDEM